MYIALYPLYRSTLGESGEDVGHFILCMRPDLFVPRELFLDRMEELKAILKAQPTAEGHEEVLMPGEPESRATGERRLRGVPLQADVLYALRKEATSMGIEFPSPLSA